MVSGKALIVPSADLPTTNWPPHASPTAVPSSAPIAVVLFLILVSHADFDDNRNNVSPASFISIVIETNLTEVLQALGDPVRLAIVSALAVETEPRACGTFAYLGVSPSTLSHHFKVLREAGVVETRPFGHQRLNSLARASLEADYPGLLESVLAAARV